jgi:hypothetical protein
MADRGHLNVTTKQHWHSWWTQLELNLPNVTVYIANVHTALQSSPSPLPVTVSTALQSSPSPLSTANVHTALQSSPSPLCYCTALQSSPSPLCYCTALQSSPSPHCYCTALQSSTSLHCYCTALQSSPSTNLPFQSAHELTVCRSEQILMAFNTWTLSSIHNSK